MDNQWGKLETNLVPEYSAWKKKDDKASRGALLKKLQPSIDRGISANVGRQVSPVLRGSARKLALNSLKTYDHSRARLGTHVINHMQGLRRIARKQQQVLPVPERVAIDRNFIQRATVELEDRLGRDPTMSELADHTKLSESRIKKVQKHSYPVYEGSLLAVTGESGGHLPAVEHEQMPLLIRAVYDDLDPVSQNIMAWTMNLHGKTYSNQEIAARLKLSPGAVSQRKAIIQMKLDELEQRGLF